MSFTYRGEVAQERQSSISKDEETFRRVFLVLSDADSGYGKGARLCAGVPRLGSTYSTSTESQPLARCISKTAQPVTGSRRLWAVECIWSTKHDDQDPEEGDDQEDPEIIELEPPDVEFGFETFRVPVTGKAKLSSDSEGQENEFGGVTTSAGELYDPPAEMDESRPVLTITRNELVFFPSLAIEFQDAVNSDVFLGAQPRQAKIQGIGAKRTYKKNIRYWRVTYTIVFKRETWDLQLLDIGTFHFENGDDGEKLIKHFVTEDDPPQPKQGLLNGFGFPLDEGDEPKFRRFAVYQEKAFANLRLEGALQ